MPTRIYSRVEDDVVDNFVVVGRSGELVGRVTLDRTIPARLVNAGEIEDVSPIKSKSARLSQDYSIINAGHIFADSTYVPPDDEWDYGSEWPSEAISLDAGVRATVRNTGEIISFDGHDGGAYVDAIAIDLGTDDNLVVNQGLIIGDVVLKGDKNKFIGAPGSVLEGDLQLGSNQDATIANVRLLGTVEGAVFLGGGQDSLLIAESGGVIQEYEGRDPYVSAGSGADSVINHGVGEVRIDLGEGDDRYRGFGTAHSVDGDEGDDTLRGGDEADRLLGADGQDFLTGRGGGDVLAGGPGSDVLVGGEGDDTLHGGAASDRYVFRPGSGEDVVTSFVPGVEVLDLSAYGFDGADDGRLSISAAGEDTVIDLAGDDSITIVGAAVSSEDILF